MPKTVRRNTTSKKALKPGDVAARAKRRTLQRQFKRDPQTQLISNVRDIVGALDGVDEMARWLSIQPSSVLSFLMNDAIPNGWHFRLFWHLTSIGYIVDPYALQWASEGMTPNNDKQLAHLNSSIQTLHQRRRARTERYIARKDRPARKMANLASNAWRSLEMPKQERHQ